MRYFPVFLDLLDRPALVIGGGVVGLRKTHALLEAGARVQVVSIDLHDELRELAESGRIVHLSRRFEDAQLDGVRLVIAATDDRALQAEVAAAAERRGIPVNVVDDLLQSTAILPARVDRGAVQVAISTSGVSPVLARLLRARIERVLEPSLAALAALAGRWRKRVQRVLPPERRRGFWSAVLQGPVAHAVAAARLPEAERALSAQLASARRAIETAQGHVALVGAGPGNPELLTLRALALLQEADVVLHDRLVSPQILGLARKDAEFIDVGKRPGDARSAQARINERLVAEARRGRRVVRLKGGDPFIFGRGGEELEALQANGLAYEVVPGITAALGCAAYAGIPLTHREHASSLRVLSAHCRESLDELDWHALAAERQTLAIYMGVGLLDGVRARLLAHGRDGSTPFALIENGTRPEQRVVLGILDELPEQATRHRVQAPALLVLGEVAALGASLAWFGAVPLGSSTATALSQAA